jgi:flagellar biosynthesis/type III secretory pathway protein FliH
LGVALAALMRVPRERTAWLAAEALRRILQSPLTAHQQFLLGECVQAYLAMDQEQRDEFNRLITSPPYQGVRTMNVTWFEEGVIKGRKEGLKEGVQKGLKEGVRKGLKEGVEKGVAKGRREALRELLKERFGPLSPQVLKRLEQLPTNRLMPLMRAALRANSLKELGLDE